MTRKVEEAPRAAERWVSAAVGLAAVVTLLWSGLAIAKTRMGGDVDAGETAETRAVSVSASALASSSAAAGESVPPPSGAASQAPPSAGLYDEILSVTDADAAGDDWFVLDARGEQVHRLNANGEVELTFGRGGSGPGEFGLADGLAVHHDTVVVAELTGRSLHLYTLDGVFIEDRRLDVAECPVGMNAGVVSTPVGIAALVSCADPSMQPTTKVVIERDGEFEVLRSIRTTAGSGPVYPLMIPVLAAHPDGLVVGLAHEDCLAVIGFDGSERGEVCHPWVSRMPIRDADRAAILQLAERLKSRGIEIQMPAVLPGIDGIYMDGDVAVYRAPAGTLEDSYRLVTEGQPGVERVLDVPPAPGVFVSEAGVLLAWDELEGTRILMLPQVPR